MKIVSVFEIYSAEFCFPILSRIHTNIKYKFSLYSFKRLNIVNIWDDILKFSSYVPYIYSKVKIEEKIMAEDFSLERLSGVQKQDMAEYTKSQTSAEESISLFSKDASSAAMVDSFSHVEDVEDVAEISEESFEVEETGNKKQSGGGVTAIANMIRKAVARHSDVKIKDVDVNYWAERINRVSSRYNIPAALIVGIIEKETNGKFTKNVNSSGGAGPMQMTTITCQDFFPGASGNRYELYKLMDKELVNSIVYKDAACKTKRAGSPSALRNMAAQNDELGIKMGVLAFEMKFVEAVAGLKHINVRKAITGLQDGTIKLTEAQSKQCVITALKNYNSVFKTYAPQVADSLQNMGMSFSRIPAAIKANKH